MFEVGFWELALIFALGLIVLGPEKLPRVAAQLGRYAGQARRMARTLSNQIRDELEAEEERIRYRERHPAGEPPEPPEPAATPAAAPAEASAAEAADSSTDSAQGNLSPDYTHHARSPDVADPAAEGQSPAAEYSRPGVDDLIPRGERAVRREAGDDSAYRRDA